MHAELIVQFHPLLFVCLPSTGASTVSRKNALFSGRCMQPLFRTPTASFTVIIITFFLSQPKRGKGRGVFSSSSSALKEKLEERRREIIRVLAFATRLTFKSHRKDDTKYNNWSICCFFTFKILFPYSLIGVILRWPLLHHSVGNRHMIY